MAEQAKNDRPKATPEQIKTWKRRIIKGLWKGRSMDRLLKRKRMPTRQRVYSWLNPKSKSFDEDFLNDYQRAREEQADLHADRIRNVQRLVRRGELDPAAGRVIMQADMWLAGKMKPKKYGDKLDLTSGDLPLESQIVIKLPDNKRE